MSYYAQTADVSSPGGRAMLDGEVTSKQSVPVEFYLFGRPGLNQSVQIQKWTRTSSDRELNTGYIYSGRYVHYGYIQPYNPPSGQGGNATVTCYGQ